MLPSSLVRAWPGWRGDHGNSRNTSLSSPLSPCPEEPCLSRLSGSGSFPSLLEPSLRLGPASGQKAHHRPGEQTLLGPCAASKIQPFDSPVGVVPFYCFRNAFLYIVLQKRTHSGWLLWNALQGSEAFVHLPLGCALWPGLAWPGRSPCSVVLDGKSTEGGIMPSLSSASSRYLSGPCNFPRALLPGPHVILSPSVQQLALCQPWIGGCE